MHYLRARPQVLQFSSIAHTEVFYVLWNNNNNNNKSNVRKGHLKKTTEKPLVDCANPQHKQTVKN